MMEKKIDELEKNIESIEAVKFDLSDKNDEQEKKIVELEKKITSAESEKLELIEKNGEQGRNIVDLEKKMKSETSECLQITEKLKNKVHDLQVSQIQMNLGQPWQNSWSIVILLGH